MNVGTYAFILERDLAYSFTVLFFISVYVLKRFITVILYSLYASRSLLRLFLLLPGSKNRAGKG
ncbi:hypothetical protein A7311_08940 [Paenibacillus polymyxa]|nr:hypothetical protein A7311_08940 [Paenibacillus polymyxa]